MSPEAALARRHPRFASPSQGAATWARPVCRWDSDRAWTETCASLPLCRRPTYRSANPERSHLSPARIEFRSPDPYSEPSDRAACAFFLKSCWNPSLQMPLRVCWRFLPEIFCRMQNSNGNSLTQACWRQVFSAQLTCSRCSCRTHSCATCSVSLGSWQCLWFERNPPAHPALLTTRSAEPEVPGAGFS